MNAVDQSRFRETERYDGVADIKLIAIQSVTSRFGGVRAANADFCGTNGSVGPNATRIAFTGPVRIGNLSASGSAEAMLRAEEGT